MNGERCILVPFQQMKCLSAAHRICLAMNRDRSREVNIFVLKLMMEWSHLSTFY